METIATSVIASLLTLVVLGIIRIVWNYWFENFWLKLTCRHISDISGNWLYECKDDKWSRREEIIVKQHGWKIRGEINYTYTDAGSYPTSNQYLFEGIFRNDLLSVYYWHTNRKIRGSGSFTLQLKAAGDVLEGAAVVYATDKSKVISEEYRWTRIVKPSSQ